MAVKTLKDFRGTVPAKGKGDFAKERNRAKLAVARRVLDDLKVMLERANVPSISAKERNWKREDLYDRGSRSASASVSDSKSRRNKGLKRGVKRG